MKDNFQLCIIIQGYTNAEVIADNHDYIKYIEKIDKVRTTILLEKYKRYRRKDLKIFYISGATGTGKTRGILDTHGDENVYRVNDYLHPFDGYSCQNVLCFDEFRSQLRISDMLNYLDIYPIQLPSRYYNKVACYNIVYIVSNWKLEEEYMDRTVNNKFEKEIQKDLEDNILTITDIKNLTLNTLYETFKSWLFA